MKRGFGAGLLRTALLALCVSLFTFSAIAGSVAHVVVIKNATWSTRAIYTAGPDGAEVALSNCFYPPLTLSPGQSVLIEDSASVLCSLGSDASLIDLPVTRGTAEVMTELTYRDPLGNLNTLSIPSLTTFLPATSPANTTLRFQRIENGSDGRSTFFAIFSRGFTYLQLTTFDGAGKVIGTETVAMTSGFRFYELQNQVSIGAVEIKEGIGCFTCDVRADLYAVAFVGQRAGGSPRVELPTLNP
jgi:hypothetical protein